MEPLASGDRRPPGPPRPPAPPGTAFGPDPRRPGRGSGGVEFLRGARSELRRVAWPPAGETVHTVAIVVGTLAVLMTLIVAFDIAASTGTLFLSH